MKIKNDWISRFCLFSLLLNILIFVKISMVGDVNSRNHQAYLLRFKANYIEKIRGYPHFSLWIPTALVRSLSRHRPGRKKKAPADMGTP